MSTAFRGMIHGLILVAITATLLLPTPAAAQQTPERKPMTIEDVRRMVEQGVRPQTILAALRQNCLAVYGLNEEMQRELIAAGAEPELIQGLSNVCWGAPGGPVLDPTKPFVMITDPGEWTADAPQPIDAAPGSSIRLRGLVHAPSGIRSLEVNGEAVPLAAEGTGPARFSTVVRVDPGTRAVQVVLQPREGDAYRKTLPLRLTAAGARTTGAAVPRPYNPGTVALSGIVPGLAQFRTDNAVLGAAILAGAGAGIVAALSTETTVRCGADLPESGECPSNAILTEETERPLLIPGIAAAGGITILGAVLGYTAAKSANERAARSGAAGHDPAGVRLGQAVLERLPVRTAAGGWAFQLARLEF